MAVEKSDIRLNIFFPVYIINCMTTSSILVQVNCLVIGHCILQQATSFTTSFPILEKINDNRL